MNLSESLSLRVSVLKIHGTTTNRYVVNTFRRRLNTEAQGDRERLPQTGLYVENS